MTLTPSMFAGKTTFVLGSEKHAGKTTLLNYLLGRLRAAGEPVAYLSVGLDGEMRDAPSGAAKPRVTAAAGDYVVTARRLLEQSDLSVEIREVFPFSTLLGPSVLAKVLRGGPIELVGPGSNAQLAEVLEHIAREESVRTILVDGAVNRVTQIAASARAACVMVLRVHRGNVGRALEMMRRVWLLQQVTVDDELTSSPETLHFEGAFTAQEIPGLPEPCRRLVFEDFAHVFLSYSELLGLSRRLELRVRHRLEFLGFVVNLYELTAGEFLRTLNAPAMAEQVAFNPYMEAA